jgi:hypothetical protein
MSYRAKSANRSQVISDFLRPAHDATAAFASGRLLYVLLAASQLAYPISGTTGKGAYGRANVRVWIFYDSKQAAHAQA